MLRMMIFILVLLGTGCVSHPPPAALPNAAGAAAPQPAEKANNQTDARLKKLGFKLVDRDGQKRYCRTDFQTGSHISADIVCLTAEQLQSIADDQQRTLDYNLQQIQQVKSGGLK
jgi:hypothetical protein